MLDNSEQAPSKKEEYCRKFSSSATCAVIKSNSFRNSGKMDKSFAFLLLKCEYLKVIFISLLDFYHHIRAAT